MEATASRSVHATFIPMIPDEVTGTAIPDNTYWRLPGAYLSRPENQSGVSLKTQLGFNI